MTPEQAEAFSDLVHEYKHRRGMPVNIPPGVTGPIRYVLQQMP